jgi:hypothetical protein
MLRIAHIVNPFIAPEGSEMHRVQPVTFETMRHAKAAAADVAEVELLAALFANDRDALPAGFTATPELTRSLADVLPGSKRQLPLLADVLERAVQTSQADYIVYTNVDIALMPGFYRMVAHYAAKGYDAFAINRRRISGRYNSVAQLDEMYAEAGETHTGFDTLVFHRDLFPKFILDTTVIGLPFVDMTFMHNLYAHATHFRLFTGKHLTFHIGMDLAKSWGNAPEMTFNKTQAVGVVKKLYPHYNISNFPGAYRGLFVRHFKWLMNPTFHYPTMLRLDFSQFSKPRRRPEKQPLTEVNQSWLEWLVKRVNFEDEW